VRSSSSRSFVTFVIFLAACGGTAAKLPSRAQVRACETATACEQFGDMRTCLESATDFKGDGTPTPSNLIACLAAAGADCDAAAACLNLGAPATSCGDPMTATTSCDGDIVRLCAGGKPLATDCAAEGLHCITGTNGFAGCGLRACDPDFNACVDADTLVTCDQGVETRTDCSVDDLGCITNGGSSGFCGGVGTACEDRDSCDGDVAVHCDGHQSRVDCAKKGLHCVYLTNGFIECANGSACDDTAPATCDADGVVHYCFLGTPLVADCVADGFSGCSATGGCVP
jgi:hypothetical protein